MDPVLLRARREPVRSRRPSLGAPEEPLELRAGGGREVGAGRRPFAVGAGPQEGGERGGGVFPFAGGRFAAIVGDAVVPARRPEARGAAAGGGGRSGRWAGAVSAGLVVAVGVVAVGVVAAVVVGVVAVVVAVVAEAAVGVLAALAAGVEVLEPPPPHAARPTAASTAASSSVTMRPRLIGLRPVDSLASRARSYYLRRGQGHPAHGVRPGHPGLIAARL